MKLLLLALCCLVSADKLKFKTSKLQSEQCQNGAVNDTKRTLYRPKTYQINLDLAPEDRWTQLGSDYGHHVKHILDTVIDIINKIDKDIVPFILEHLSTLAKSLPREYVQEMTGLAKASNVDFGEIVLFNVFYEMFSACTSIIAQGENGDLIHARNLDFGLFVGWDFQNMTWPLAEALRPAVVTMQFQRANKTLYTSAGFVGYIGVFTGVKPNAFSFSANERFSLDGGYVGIIEWLMGKHTGNWLGFYSRDIFEKCDDYDCAKQNMMNAEMVAPVYFIIADGKSKKNGAVITRSREKTEGVVDLYQEKDMTKSGSWFVLQTNYDPWDKPPFYDNRRDPGIKCMNTLAENETTITRDGIFDVLSTKPNLNMLTVYTSVMNLGQGTIDTFIRYCPFPCSPW